MFPVHRQLAGDALHLDLAREIQQLEASDILRSTGRNARTLVKEGPLRITLIALAAGGQIAVHRAQAPVSIQVLRGALRMQVGQSAAAVDLAAGELLVLGAGVEHAVSSDGGGVFLLTVVHSDSSGASRATEARRSATSEGSTDAGHSGSASLAEPIGRPTMASDSTGLTYSCRDGEIWVHYPVHGARSAGPDDPGFAIGPIPPGYATHPPNAITAERVSIWRSLCSQQ
jgi:quercetin dioxygenase-like cupin family protein